MEPRQFNTHTVFHCAIVIRAISRRKVVPIQAEWNQDCLGPFRLPTKAVPTVSGGDFSSGPVLISTRCSPRPAVARIRSGALEGREGFEQKGHVQTSPQQCTTSGCIALTVKRIASCPSNWLVWSQISYTPTTHVYCDELHKR